MKQTLSFNADVSKAATSTPSTSEQAQRLESFEIKLRDKQIEDLTQSIMLATAEHQQEIIALQNSQTLKLKKQRESFTLALETVEVNNGLDDDKAEKLRHYSDQLAQAGNQLAIDKDNLTAEVATLQQRLEDRAKVMTSSLDKQRDLETEIKRLNAFNPERQAKKIKELQATNTEKTAALTTLRKQCRQLKKDNEEKSRVIIRLDDAVDKSVKMINEGLKREPLETFELGAQGTWELYGCEVMNRYEVTDTENRNSIGVDVVDGVISISEVRGLPTQVVKHIAWRAAGNVKNEEILAQVKQPLNSKEA